MRPEIKPFKPKVHTLSKHKFHQYLRRDILKDMISDKIKTENNTKRMKRVPSHIISKSM